MRPMMVLRASLSQGCDSRIPKGVDAMCAHARECDSIPAPADGPMTPHASQTPPASSVATRRTMQANRAKNTSPELDLRRLLRKAGYPGYRLHWKKAVGHPDVAYPGKRVAIFVNGCFWHRCPRCNPTVPKSNTEFWEGKFRANQARDARNNEVLESSGWNVVVVWECELRDNPEDTVMRIVDALERSDESDSDAKTL